MSCVCEDLAGPGMELSPVCLGQIWIFADLSPEDTHALLAASLKRRYTKGEVIFSQGSEASETFLIKAGRVKLSKVTEDGDEIILDIRKAGDFIGEQALTEDMEFPVTAVCLEDVLTCGYLKSRFEEIVLERPTIGLQVIKNLSKRIDGLTRRIGTMSMTNLEERLYRVLAQVAHEHGVRSREGLAIQFPLTHEDLSFLVGAHRVSVTRAMKSLRQAGRISQQGRALVVAV